MRDLPARLSDLLPAEPSASYQCLLASAVQQVDKVEAVERAAEEAALSLGQRERIAALTAETRALRSTLVESADARARALLAPQTTWLSRVKAQVTGGTRAEPASPATWEPALRDACRVVVEAAECVRTLGASLPAGGAAARLADEVSALLRRHRDVLGAEITRWAA